MLYWDLIEEFLPDFEERADVKFDTSLFNFIHGGDVPEEDLPALKTLAKSGWLSEVFFRWKSTCSTKRSRLILKRKSPLKSITN